MAEQDKLLRTLANAIHDLAGTINSNNPHLKVSDVVQFCRICTPAFFLFGIAFKFADLEVQNRVNNLGEASKKYDTIQAMVKGEIEIGLAKDNSSHCRNLVRVKRIIVMARVFCEQILSSEGNSLVEPCTIAYEQSFAPYHGWTAKKAVIASLQELPSRDLLLRTIKEDENSVKEPVEKYVTASKVVVQYIDNIFQSTETGAELLMLI